MSEPKFLVGERVDVIEGPAKAENVLITAFRTVENAGLCLNAQGRFGLAVPGNYYTCDNYPGLWILECCLRSRPGNDLSQWQDCVFKPNKINNPQGEVVL